MQGQKFSLSILKNNLLIDLALSHDQNKVFSLQMVLQFFQQKLSLLLSISIILGVVPACYFHQHLLYSHVGYAFVAVSQFGIGFLGVRVAA